MKTTESCVSSIPLPSTSFRIHMKTYSVRCLMTIHHHSKIQTCLQYHGWILEMWFTPSTRSPLLLDASPYSANERSEGKDDFSWNLSSGCEPCLPRMIWTMGSVFGVSGISERASERASEQASGRRAAARRGGPRNPKTIFH